MLQCPLGQDTETGSRSEEDFGVQPLRLKVSTAWRAESRALVCETELSLERKRERGDRARPKPLRVSP